MSDCRRDPNWKPRRRQAAVCPKCGCRKCYRDESDFVVCQNADCGFAVHEDHWDWTVTKVRKGRMFEWLMRYWQPQHNLDREHALKLVRSWWRKRRAK